MNRLQEYLKTPNPMHPEFFSPKSCHQDQNQNLFAQNEAHPTKFSDQLNFQISYRSPAQHLQIKKFLDIESTPRNNQRQIKKHLAFDSQIQDNELQTPSNRKQKNNALQTTANKKYDLRIPGATVSQHNQSKETERTLRLLASEAYNVVCSKGSSTYKTVSEQIINNNSDMLSNKEQNNIKRRVYDALNVLIALGKLQKKGRKILPSRSFQQQKIIRQNHKQKIVQLKRILNQKQNNLKSKKKFLKNEQRKGFFIKKLLNRNKSLNSTQQKNSKVQMPFILAYASSFKKLKQFQDNQVKITLKKEKNCSNTFFGDIDVLNFLKFQTK